MNQKIKWVLGIIVIVLIIWYIQLSFNSLTSKNMAKTIKVGVSLPMTGNSASIGERVNNGMNIALEEVQASSSWKLIPVIEDDKGESTAAVSAVNKLITIDKVKIIIGLLKSDPLLAVAPITEKNKVIILSPTAGATSITEAGDYVFRNIETPDIHGKKAAEFLLGLGIKKAALFMAQASNAQSYGIAFEKNFTSLGGTIVYRTSYVSDTNDVRTDVAKAKSFGAEAFYVGVATAKDGGLVVKQSRENKFEGKIIVSVAADAPEFINIAGQLSEGVIVTAAPFTIQDPLTHNYTEKYKIRYGKESDGFAANGYDAVWLIAKAVEKCQGDNTDCIRDFLYNTKNYPGMGGLTTFDNKGDVTKPVQLKIVKDGVFIPYKL